MRVEHFKFEIRPWRYTANEGESVMLEVQVTVNGSRHTSERILPNVRPYETEIEYYSRMAVSVLHDLLKKGEPSEN